MFGHFRDSLAWMALRKESNGCLISVAYRLLASMSQYNKIVSLACSRKKTLQHPKIFNSVVHKIIVWVGDKTGIELTNINPT